MDKYTLFFALNVVLIFSGFIFLLFGFQLLVKDEELKGKILMSISIVFFSGAALSTIYTPESSITYIEVTPLEHGMYFQCVKNQQYLITKNSTTISLDDNAHPIKCLNSKIYTSSEINLDINKNKSFIER